MAKSWTTGISFNERVLEWCSLKQAGSRKEGRDSQSNSLPFEEATDAAFEKTVQRAAAQLRGSLHVAIPAEQTLIHVVELPSVELDELEGMVALQLEDIAPYPPEQMSYDFEVLSMQETVSTVAIVAVHRSYIEDIGDAFSSAKLKIKRLDVDVFSRWNQMLRLHPEIDSPGVRLFLWSENSHEVLLAAKESTLLSIRPLAVPDEGETWLENIREEVEITLTGLESSMPGVEPRELQIWHQGGTPHLGELASNIGMPVKTHAVAQLPPLANGVAERGIRFGAEQIDLVPQEWKDEETAFATRKKFTRTATAIVGCWLLVLGGFFGLNAYENNRLNTLEKKVAELEGPVAQVLLKSRQGASLSQFSDRTFSVLECFRDAIVHLPPGIEFEGWSYRKGKGVSIKGSAETPDPILTYNKNLEGSELYTSIKNEGIVNRRGKSEFRFTTEIPEVDL